MPDGFRRVGLRGETAGHRREAKAAQLPGSGSGRPKRAGRRAGEPERRVERTNRNGGRKKEKKKPGVGQKG